MLTASWKGVGPAFCVTCGTPTRPDVTQKAGRSVAAVLQGVALVPTSAIRVEAGHLGGSTKAAMDENQRRRQRAREIEVPGLSPVRAFFLVCALATIVGGGFFATRDASPTEPPTPAAPRSPDYTLTDAEAIAEFERLNAQLMQAYDERNIALAEAVFTSDSPMLPRVRKEIRTLLRSSRISRTRFEPMSTSVQVMDSESVVLERVEIVRPRFETERGRDATAKGRPHRQRIEWTLHIDGGAWLLHDAVIVGVKPIRGDGES
jgi:hypothetical protein